MSTEPAQRRLHRELVDAAILLDGLGQRLSRYERDHGAAVLGLAQVLAERCRVLGEGRRLSLYFFGNAAGDDDEDVSPARPKREQPVADPERMAQAMALAASMREKNEGATEHEGADTD